VNLWGSINVFLEAQTQNSNQENALVSIRPFGRWRTQREAGGNCLFRFGQRLPMCLGNLQIYRVENLTIRFPFSGVKLCKIDSFANTKQKAIYACVFGPLFSLSTATVVRHAPLGLNGNSFTVLPL